MAYIPPDYDPWMDDFVPPEYSEEDLSAAPPQKIERRPYDEFTLEGMRYGLTRAQVIQSVPRAQFSSFEKQEAQDLTGKTSAFELARSQLEEQYAPGYTQHRQQMAAYSEEKQKEARAAGIPWQESQKIHYAPVSPVQWRNFPEHLKQRRLQGIPLEKDESGAVDVPSGYLYRKGGKFAFPIETLKSSWLGVTEKADEFLSTFATSKLMKRVQMLGAHEQVGLSQRPGQEAPFLAGPGASRKDVMTPLRTAMVLGGDPGAAGQGYIDPRVGNITRTTSMDVAGEGVGAPVEIGTIFKRGTNVRLAGNVAGFTSREWDYTVKDVQSLGENAGFRYTLEQSAPVTERAVAAKYGQSKAFLEGRDLSNITGEGGKSLNLDMMVAMKDVQGAAHTLFQGEWAGANQKQREKIAKELGYGSIADMPGSFAEMADPILKRMVKNAGGEVQNIYVPTVLHKDSLERHAATTVSKEAWVNPLTGNVDPNRFQTTQRYQAVIGDVLTQLMKEYDVKRVTLGPEDLGAMRNVNPKLAGQLEKEGAPIRKAYQDVIDASLASGPQKREIAGGTVQAGSADFRFELEGAVLQAQAAAREELGLGMDEPVDEKLIARRFVEQMAQGAYADKFIEWGKGFVTAPFESMKQFTAEGLLKDREVSPYLSSVWGMARSALNREGGKFVEARDRTMKEQRVLAESQKATRRAEGVTLEHQRASGWKALSLPGLADNEFYSPTRKAGETSYLFGFPSAGEESFDPRLQGMAIDASMVTALGGSADRFYVSEGMAQALGRDFDADIIYELMTGSVTQKNGKFYDEEGTELSTEAVKEMGRKRIAQGAGDLAKEHAGYEAMQEQGRTGPLSPKDALREGIDWLSRKAQPVRMSGEEIQGEVTKGRQLYEAIGPYYQNMRRMFSRVGDAAERGGVRDIWNEIHGYAQRPANLPSDYQQLMDMTYSTAKGGIFRKAKGYGEYAGPVKGLKYMQSQTAQILAERVKRGDITAGSAAALMAPDSPGREAIAGTFRRYRGGEIGVGEMLVGKSGNRAGGIMVEMSPERWATESVTGQYYGAQLVSDIATKADREGIDRSKAFRLANMEPDFARRMLETKEEMQAYTDRLKKGGSVEDYAEAVEKSKKPAAWEMARKAPTPQSQADAKAQMQAAEAQAIKSLPTNAPRGWSSAEATPGEKRAPVPETPQAPRQPAQQPVSTPAPEAPNISVQVPQPGPTLAQQALAQIGGMPALQQTAQDIAAYKAQHGRSAIPPAEMRATRQAVDWMGQQGGATAADYAEWGQIVGQVGIGFSKGSGPAGYYHSYTGLSPKQQAKSPDPASPPNEPPKKPPKEPPVEQPPDWWGGDPDNETPKQKPKGQQQQQQGFTPNVEQPWKSNAWLGNKDIGSIKKAAEQLEQWGDKVGEAILGTETFNREQKALVKEFEGYRKTVQKADSTLEQMRNDVELVKGVYGDSAAIKPWIKSMEGRIKQGEEAIDDLSMTSGFWSMEKARGHFQGTERAQQIAGAAGGGGSPPGGIRGWIQGQAGKKYGDYGAAGFAAGALNRFTSGWELMRLQRLWGMTGAPVFNEFIPAAAQTEMTGWQASTAMGGYAPGLPSGVAGGVMQYQAAKQQAVINAGRTGYEAWGWAQQSMGGMKQAQALLGPAAGAGLIAGALGTSGAMAAGLGTAAAATTIGLPLTLGVGTIAGLVGMGHLAESAAAPTAESQLALVAGERGKDGGKATVNWRQVLATMGMLTPEDNLASVQPRVQAQMERGQQLTKTQLGALNPQDRAAVLNYIAQGFQKQEDTLWSGMDEKQILGVMQQAMPFVDVGNMSANQFLGQARPGANEAQAIDLMQTMAATGRSPAEYMGLAGQMGMGRELAVDLFMSGTRMSMAQEQQWQGALGQYAGMTQFGYSAEEVVSKTRPDMAASARDMFAGRVAGGKAEWEKLSGPGAIAMQMVPGVVSQYAQAQGVTRFESTAFAEQMRELAASGNVAEIEQWGTAAGLAGGASQAMGQDLTGLAVKMLGTGVAPSAISTVMQGLQGQGRAGQALGAPSGFALDLPLMQALGTGQINTMQYGQLASAAQFGMGKMGYSMMTGNFGIGSQLRQTFDTLGGMGMGPGIPTGQALMDASGYSLNQLEMRDLGWQGMYAGQAHQRQGWALQQQQMDAGWANTQASQAYQMAGLNANIGQQQEQMAFTQAMRELTHEMTALRRGQQSRQMDRAEQNLDMQTRQSLERLGMSERMWMSGVGFRRQEMGIQEEQMGVRQEWAREDLAYGRQMAGFQYEYQADELQRNIRMATGRQKAGLLRQKEYMEQVYSMEEGRRGTQEERTDKTQQWEREGFQRQRAQFEETTRLQRQQFDMQKRHILERYAFEKERIEEQRRDMQAIWELEDRQRALQEAWQDKQMQFQLDQMERQKAYYENTVFPYQEQQHKFQQQSLDQQVKYYEDVVFPNQIRQRELQEEVEDAQAAYVAWQIKAYEQGGPVYDAFSGFIEKVVQKLDDLQLTGGQKVTLKLSDGTAFEGYIEGVVSSFTSRREQAGGWGQPWEY